MKKINLHAIILAIAALLCAVSGVSASAAYPSGECTNAVTEGIEYRISETIRPDTSDRWRSELQVLVETKETGLDAGYVLSMELATLGNSLRYQCTEVLSGNFSCNSLPAGSVITAVYLRYVPGPNITEDTKINFNIQNAASGKTLMKAGGTVQYPVYPCSRNSAEKNLTTYSSALIYNTSGECPNDNKTIHFKETMGHFAMVNIINGDSLDSNRVRLTVSPKVDYKYTLELDFVDAYGNLKAVTYEYDPADPNNPVIDASDLDGITISEMPLTLTGGYLKDISATKTDLWGNDVFPTVSSFVITFYYQNYNGTQGYHNSAFHFKRDLTVRFGPYCAAASDSASNGESGGFDPCGGSGQLFTVSFKNDSGEGIYVPKNESECSEAAYCTSIYSVYVESDYIPDKGETYQFVTRKCADSTCSSVTTTNAYLSGLFTADGDSLRTEYQYKSVSGKTVSTFRIKAYDRTTPDLHPFEIMGAQLKADEPGSYVVYGFVDSNDIKAGDLSQYAVKFYITVTEGSAGGYFTRTGSGESAGIRIGKINPPIYYASLEQDAENVFINEAADEDAADGLVLETYVIGFRENELSLNPGESVSDVFTADFDGETQIAGSSNPSVVAIDGETGTITAVSAGEAGLYIADISSGEVLSVCAVTVSEEPAPTAEPVSPAFETTSITIAPNETIDLNLTAPVDGTTYVLNSTNGDVAVVNAEAGTLTGLTEGFAGLYIASVADGEIAAVCDVTVARPAEVTAEPEVTETESAPEITETQEARTAETVAETTAETAQETPTETTETAEEMPVTATPTSGETAETVTPTAETTEESVIATESETPAEEAPVTETATEEVIPTETPTEANIPIEIPTEDAAAETEVISEIHVAPRSEKIYITAGSDVLLDMDDITVSPQNVPFTELDLEIEDPALAYIPPEQEEDDIREFGLRIVGLHQGTTKLRITLRGSDVHFDIELCINEAASADQTVTAEYNERRTTGQNTAAESASEETTWYEDVIPYPED